MLNTTDHVGFVANPNCGRGTISLLLLCFSTIVLCVYTSLHLDVPTKALNTGGSILRKSYNVLFCVIAPEFFTLLAFLQWFDARYMRKTLKSKLGLVISRQQALFIASNGIHVRNKDGTRELLLSELAACEGCFCMSNSEAAECRQFWWSIVSNLPCDRELDDKSKSSPVAKVITCLQAGKTLVLILNRLAQRLEVSLLEVATVAYIVVTVLSYIFWFSKPYDIQLHTTINVQIDIREKNAEDVGYRNLSDPGFISTLSDILPDSANFYPEQGLVGYIFPDVIAAIILSSIFASIHCAAWNYAFPSQTEALLWRISCVWIATIPIFNIALAFVHGSYRKNKDMTHLICAAMYVLARLVLIVELFTSLRSAPRGIYKQPNWTPYLGHDGA